MTPRTKMFTLNSKKMLFEALPEINNSGFSRIPVYAENQDNIVGIVHVRDVLKSLEQDQKVVSLESIMREPIFVSQEKRVSDLLKEMQGRQTHMAIVIDEFGGVEGCVTLEDLLEEIVGEIHDEFDSGAPQIKKIKEGEFYIDARIDIDDLSVTLGIEFEGEGFDTIGGFVLHQLGKIPSPSDNLQYNGFNIEVLTTVGRRIKTLKITEIPSVQNPETTKN